MKKLNTRLKYFDKGVDRCVSWRLITFEPKKNCVYPDWVTWTWFRNPHVGRTLWREYET